MWRHATRWKCFLFPLKCSYTCKAYPVNLASGEDLGMSLQRQPPRKTAASVERGKGPHPGPSFLGSSIQIPSFPCLFFSFLLIFDAFSYVGLILYLSFFFPPQPILSLSLSTYYPACLPWLFLMPGLPGLQHLWPAPMEEQLLRRVLGECQASDGRAFW